MTPRNFPWRIFWRTLVTQIIGFIFVVLSALFLAFWFLPISIDQQIQSQFQTSLGIWLLKLIPLVLIYIIAMSLYLSYRFVLPLSSVIGRARAITFKDKKSKTEEDSSTDESIFEEEVGEYFEMEQILRRIKRKFKKKREQVFSLREEHEALLLAMADAVVTVDRNQKLTSFNSNFAAQFLSREQTQGETKLTEVIRQPEVLTLFNQSLLRGESGKVEVQSANLLGTFVHIFSVNVSPLKKQKTGEIYGALGIFQDISELKRAEQIRIEFVGNASHELRTPLTSVKGYVDTLKEDIDAGHTENFASFINIIHRNVGRLVDLVNDLLLISKLESNAELIIEEVNPEQAVASVLDSLSTQIKDKQHQVSVTSTVNIMFADALKLEQILMNLISNAVKYTPAQGRIRVEINKDEKENILLSVIDNGPGIPAAHMGRLFERFYRVDKGRSREAGGTGLGLAIVKHIMQTHGGSVRVKSEPDVGSEFVCTFPKRSH